MRRRTFLQGAAAGLTLPRRASAASARLLKFIPQADLALLDPIQSPALVTIMHACMVFDTLYGVDDDYRSPAADGRGPHHRGRRQDLELTLREGLKFHDGTPVLARDCVASIQRWGKRDGSA